MRINIHILNIMNKTDIRDLKLKQRRYLSVSAQTEASKAIAKQIIELPSYRESKKIGLYMAINNEVNLNAIFLDAANKNKLCFFPKVIDNDNMLFLPCTNLQNVTTNKWGIAEPNSQKIQAIAAHNLDILIMPLVAFDDKGHRIGMGKGYYDKGLADNRPKLLIGCAYEFQKVADIPAQPWDIHLDIIVTEQAIYYT